MVQNETLGRGERPFGSYLLPYPQERKKDEKKWRIKKNGNKNKLNKAFIN